MRISDWSSDVCSSDLGKADRAAAAVAMLHPSLDLPGAAEQLDGLARPAFAQVRTNDGGGVDLALAGHHRLDGSDAETVLGAHRLQEPRVAGSLVAEAEVPANHHVARRQVADQDLDHEGLRRLQRKGTVEVQHEEVVHAGRLQRDRTSDAEGKRG